VKSLARSFAGGEIAPEMFGRLDLGKYQTGVQLALNFRTLAHGPAARRPGFYYVNEAADSTAAVRLIPFVFSATQAMIIELGAATARFHNSSGTVLEAAQAIVSIVGPIVTVTGHGYSTGDDVYIGARFHRITVTGADTFTTADRWGVATTAVGTTAAVVYQIATPWAAADLDTLAFTQNADVLTITSTLYPATEIRRLGATNWTTTTVSFTPTLAAPAGVACVATIPTVTNPVSQTYVVTSVAADGVTESVASSTATDNNNLTIAGNYNTITWSAAAGAARYYVYKLRGGAYGFIGQTTALTFRDDNILADTLQTPPQNFTTLNTGAGAYPGAVTHFEQRRWFAGTTNQPQNVWGTRSSTDANLTSSVPSRDDDALAFRIAAQQQNAIRHLVPLVDLIALTVGGEFRIFADGGPAITPTTLSIKPQAYSGAAAVQPALTAGSVLYVQSQGSRVRELAFDPSGVGVYKSIDISLFAPHLFNSKQVKELAYCRAPDQTLWAVRTDGTLLGLTYVPDQQVFGWHQHTTDGTIESVAVIPEDSEDVLYVVVARTIDGRTVRYIERLKSRFFDTAEDAFFVDSGLTYDGAAATVISGLYHLEGETVSILADGAVEPDQEVVNGTVTLETAASKVHVGLPYNSDLQTLPAALDGAPAMGQGTMKNVSKVHLRVAQSSIVQAGPAFDRLTTYPARAVSDPYGSPPALRTGELSLAIGPNWSTDGSVCIRQDKPLPLTVLSMTTETAVGG
jgi:hypothetical protein